MSEVKTETTPPKKTDVGASIASIVFLAFMAAFAARVGWDLASHVTHQNRETMQLEVVCPSPVSERTGELL